MKRMIALLAVVLFSVAGCMPLVHKPPTPPSETNSPHTCIGFGCGMP